MDADEAEAYHRPQIAAFVEGGADMVTAYTLTSINEAIGIARAAKAAGMPAAISFTVETDGRLVDGENVARGDRDGGSRDGGRAGILHDQLRPSDAFRETRWQAGEAWTERIHGVRANASTKSHAELDESDNARLRRSARSWPALPRPQARVSGDAHARRLLRHRSPSRPGDLRSLRAAAGAQRLIAFSSEVDTGSR